MEVILKKSIERLGVPGDVLEVADGYARNYLLPKQLAVRATERNRRHLEHNKRVSITKNRKIENRHVKLRHRLLALHARSVGVLAKMTGSSALLPLWMSQRLYGLKGLIWKDASLN